MDSGTLIDELTNQTTLYIIGNGFDLFHQLHTTTTDYCEILASKDVYGTCENACEVFESYGNDWGEYEKSLSYIDLDIIEEEILSFPDYLSDHESDRDGTIWFANEHLISLRNAVFDSLREMVEMANSDIYDSDNQIHNVFENAVAIISFNYTSTIEELYNPKDVPILHIHGYYEDGEELLFGYTVYVPTDPPSGTVSLYSLNFAPERVVWFSGCSAFRVLSSILITVTSTALYVFVNSTSSFVTVPPETIPVAIPFVMDCVYPSPL